MDILKRRLASTEDPASYFQEQDFSMLPEGYTERPEEEAFLDRDAELANSKAIEDAINTPGVVESGKISQEDFDALRADKQEPIRQIASVDQEKPLTREEALLKQLKEIQDKSDEEVKSAKTMDELAGLANVLAPQLQGFNRARALTAARSVGADPGAMPTATLSTSRAKTAIDDRSSKINSLLNQQKLLGLTGKVGKSLDPSSEASARARQTLKTMGIEVPDTMTEDEASRFGQVLLANRGKEERQKSTLELAKERLDTSKQQFSRRMDEKDQDDLIKAVDKFNSDKVVQKANEMSAGASTVLDLVRSKNPLGHAAVPTFLARASGEVGALTEADKAPFGGSRAISSRISQAIEQYKTGKITQENLQFIERLADTMQKNAIKNKNARAIDLSKQKANKKFTQDELYKSFTGEDLAPAPTKELTGEDKQAFEWAKKNPEDPRSAEILKRLGM